jgi:phage terminase large subunit GpA-like protein
VAYWINTLYSPFVRFSEIAKEFLSSKDDPDRLHNFTNSWLAEPWEDTKLKTNAELVLERQTDIEPFVLPDWTKLVTGGVDVQENCLYWTIRAWGDFLTSQNIAHGQAFSFAEIEKFMNLEYRKADGTVFMVDLVLVDSGDQTDEVYEFCAVNAEWALPCKGVGSQLSHYRLSTVNKTGSRAYGMNLVLVDGGKYKDMIASRMRKPNGKGSWMVYKGCDEEYAQQVTAEHKVSVKNGKGQQTLIWQPKTEGADNHYLDCEVYCMAAADVKGVRNLFLQNKVDAPDEKPAPKEPPAPEENWIRANDNWL